MLGRIRSALMPALERGTFVLTPGSRKGTGGRWQLLLAAPGGGNIGDQAMIDSFVENVPGPKVVIGAAGTATSDVRSVALPHLVYGSGPAHLRDLLRFARLAKSALSFSIIGADVMDGGYRPWASVARWRLATLTQRAGIPTRVIGFSWNSAPHPAAAAAMRTASAAGVRMFARDPLTLERLHADGALTAEATSDSVFALKASALPDPLPRAVLDTSDGPRLAVVNISGLIAERLDQRDDYLAILAWLRSHGYRCLVVPHVDRGDNSDLQEARRLLAAYSGGGVELVDRLLRPAEVRGLLAHTDVVVTGRMHLAIMALSRSVPTIVLATQGKVEGLAEMFGLPGMAVQPVPGFSSRVAEALEGLTQDRALRDRLSRRAEDAIATAALNFEGLR